MKNTKIKLLPIIEQESNNNQKQMQERQKINNKHPDIYFTGNFKEYGNITASIYRKENTYNILEDKEYTDDLIIEFDNHTIKDLSVMWGYRKKQFNTPQETINYLKTLEILPTNNTTNTYQKFLKEIEIETIESLNYPIAVDITTNNDEKNKKPYVTIFIATNTFPPKTNLTIENDIMSHHFNEKLENMKTDYNFYKNETMYDIYIQQENPENNTLNNVHAEINTRIFLDDNPKYYKDDIAQYIEENVLGVTYDYEEEEEIALKFCTNSSITILDNI